MSGYRIWRGHDAGDLDVLVADHEATSTSYVDDTVNPETSYHYAMAALSAAGAGPQSLSSVTTLRRGLETASEPKVEEPLIAQQQQAANPIVTFASTFAGSGEQILHIPPPTTANSPIAISFTIGTGAMGFLLDSLSFRDDNNNDVVKVSLWTDEDGSAGEKLADLGRLGPTSGLETVTLDHMNLFLCPATKYWIRFELRHYQYEISGTFATFSLYSPTGGTAPSGLTGWSIATPAKFEFKGRVLPHRTGVDVTDLPSTLIRAYDFMGRSISSLSFDNEFAFFGGDYTFTQRFTTGSHASGYELAALRLITRPLAFTSIGLGGPIREDSNDRPASAALYTLGGPTLVGLFAENTYMDYTFTPPGARLKRNIIYCLAIRRANDGFGSLPYSSPVEVTEIDSGWQIQNEVWYRDRSGVWTQRDGTFWFTVSGSCAGEPTQVECGDFPASDKTPGLVRIGEYSMGRLADEDDHDWLQIEGIRNNQRYRVEVDFLGDHATGGGFTIHTSTLGLPPVHRSDLWETNYDGHAVLDFESAIAGRPQFYLHIESDNFLNRSGPEHRFIGDYIVTINELNGVSRGGPVQGASIGAPCASVRS